MNLNKLAKSLKHLAGPLVMAVIAGVMEYASRVGEAEQEKLIEDLANRVALLEGPKEDENK